MGIYEPDQLSAQINEQEQMVLMESKTMRDQHVCRDEVLDKVKAVSVIGDKLEVTLAMAANYYEVPVETIRTLIKRHRSEFNDYEELRLLKGKTLQEFKALVPDEPDLSSVPSLQVLNRRGLLRVGMLLNESDVAASVRSYLLNVEEVSDEVQKAWAVERTISKRERRRLTDSIQHFFNENLPINEYAAFTNIVYSTVFDATAAQLKEYYGLEKSDPLRDNLTTEDLRKVVEVETVIASLLRLGKSYQEIREEMLTNKDSFR